MSNNILTEEMIVGFRNNLIRNEKSQATVEKYLRDMRTFKEFVQGKVVTKEMAIGFKNWLMERGYAVRSINSMLAAVNSFFGFAGWEHCKVKSLKVQRQIYCAEEKELTKEEYFKLLKASEDKPQLNLVLQTIAGTGIRISELRAFTVEAVRRGEVSVYCKGKVRRIIMPAKLRRKLLRFAKVNGIFGGVVFRSRSGLPLDRSNIWSAMKKLCEKAGVNPSKVFPHNFRKLFARIFYAADKDIAKLADVLGHGSIDTTRIYIVETGKEHRKRIDRLGLVV